MLSSDRDYSLRRRREFGRGYPVTKDRDRMGLSANTYSTPETDAGNALGVKLMTTGDATPRRAEPSLTPRTKAVIMHNANSPAALRRSSRVPVNLPVLVTSLEPGTRFSEVCETLVVNAHGCAMRSPVKLDAGVLLHFHSKEGRETTAKVIACQPLEADRTSWRLAARLDRPENFWGLTTCPADWAQLPAPAAPTKSKLPQQLAAKNVQIIDQGTPLSPSLKMMFDSIQKQVSDDHLRTMIADLVQPLHAELADLREKLTRGRSKFEVSLTQIPPELQDQMEERLQKNLGPRVLEQTGAQAMQVLEAAKTAIAQKTAETHDDFLKRVSRELQMVEERARALSANIAENQRENLNRGMGEFHQHVVDGGNRLKKLSEDLFRVMQHDLGEEHEVRRREFEQVQGAMAVERERLEGEVTQLDSRIAKLDESARSLESGLDKRLGQMASNTLGDVRKQLESATDEILIELETRSSRELGAQVEAAAAQLKAIQTEVQASALASLNKHVNETLRVFAQSMEELEQESVERLQNTLAGGLNSVVKTLGEHFRGERTTTERRWPAAD